MGAGGTGSLGSSQRYVNKCIRQPPNLHPRHGVSKGTQGVCAAEFWVGALGVLHRVALLDPFPTPKNCLSNTEKAMEAFVASKQISSAEVKWKVKHGHWGTMSTEAPP